MSRVKRKRKIIKNPFKIRCLCCEKEDGVSLKSNDPGEVLKDDSLRLDIKPISYD